MKAAIAQAGTANCQVLYLGSMSAAGAVVATTAPALIDRGFNS